MTAHARCIFPLTLNELILAGIAKDKEKNYCKGSSGAKRLIMANLMNIWTTFFILEAVQVQ